jgi:arginine exporter protein ArgO
MNKKEFAMQIYVIGFLSGMMLFGIGIGGVAGVLLDIETWANVAVAGAIYITILAFIAHYIDSSTKGDVFVKHIEAHPEVKTHEPRGTVVCKICDKDVDEIYDEHLASL